MKLSEYLKNNMQYFKREGATVENVAGLTLLTTGLSPETSRLIALSISTNDGLERSLSVGVGKDVQLTTKYTGYTQDMYERDEREVLKRKYKEDIQHKLNKSFLNRHLAREKPLYYVNHNALDFSRPFLERELTQDNLWDVVPILDTMLLYRAYKQEWAFPLVNKDQDHLTFLQLMVNLQDCWSTYRESLPSVYTEVTGKIIEKTYPLDIACDQKAKAVKELFEVLLDKEIKTTDVYLDI